MTRRSKIWVAIAVIFTLINLVSAVYAAILAEGLHAAIHVALTLVGGYVLRRLLRPKSQAAASEASLASDRLDHLQQSVDAVAIEVERIGEGQRYATKLAAERAGAVPQKRS